MRKHCATCKRPDYEFPIPFKRCARCRVALYCSRRCQKSDWPVHKNTCTTPTRAIFSSAAARTRTRRTRALHALVTSPLHAGHLNEVGLANEPTSALLVQIDRPFHHLMHGTWLHGRPEEDVFTLLVDTFRLWQECDSAFWSRVADADGAQILVTAPPTGGVLFRRFLGLAERHAGLLPSWWEREKRDACVAFAGEGGRWSELSVCVEGWEVVEHYGVASMPVQMRVFAEQVFGPIGKGWSRVVMGMWEARVMLEQERDGE